MSYVPAGFCLHRVQRPYSGRGVVVFGLPWLFVGGFIIEDGVLEGMGLPWYVVRYLISGRLVGGFILADAWFGLKYTEVVLEELLERQEDPYVYFVTARAFDLVLCCILCKKNKISCLQISKINNIVYLMFIDTCTTLREGQLGGTVVRDVVADRQANETETLNCPR